MSEQLNGTATDVAWRVNVWRGGAWAPHYGESSWRVGRKLDAAKAEKNVRRCFEEVGRRGEVARLSCASVVVQHLNLDRLTNEDSKAAFFDDRIRGAAFPCGRCAVLTTFIPLPRGSGLYSGKPLCGGAECAQ